MNLKLINKDKEESKANLPLEDSPHRLDEHGPVFILGCPRSGTTFLSQCVGLIDDVEEFVGVLAPPRLMHLVGSMNEEGGKDSENVHRLMACVREIFWQAFWRRRLFPSERLVRRLTSRRFLWKLFEKPRLDGAVFCYKEPFLCFAAEAFAAEFLNARFIHIVRDGRDNADSLERKYPDALADHVLRDPFLARNKNAEIGPFRDAEGWVIPWWVSENDHHSFIHASRYARCVWMWREMVERATRLQPLVGPDRYLEVSYERFVEKPVEQSERVLEFLDRPLSRSAQRRLERAHTDSIGISRSRQSAERLEEAEQIAGPLLKRLEYA